MKYVKDTSGDFSAAAQLIHEYGEAVSVFVGWDTLFLAALLEGAAGSVIGAANVVPAQLVAVYDAVQQGDLAGARSLWRTLFPLLSTFVSGGYNAGIKGGMDLIGHSGGPQRNPGEDVDSHRRELLGQSLKSLASTRLCITARGSLAFPTRLRPGAGARVRVSHRQPICAREPHVRIQCALSVGRSFDRPARWLIAGIGVRSPQSR